MTDLSSVGVNPGEKGTLRLRQRSNRRSASALKKSRTPKDTNPALLSVYCFCGCVHTTLKLAIIIMSSCSKLWQWKTYLPL
jgi:hypothetical protein